MKAFDMITVSPNRIIPSGDYVLYSNKQIETNLDYPVDMINDGGKKISMYSPVKTKEYVYKKIDGSFCFAILERQFSVAVSSGYIKQYLIQGTELYKKSIQKLGELSEDQLRDFLKLFP